MKCAHGLINVYLKSSDLDESIGNMDGPWMSISKEKF